jgi:hypothetical protein
MSTLNQARLSSRLDRARSALKYACRYQLGEGGFNPKYPFNPCPHGDSDCSGFISWVLMTQRAPKPGRDFWIETTAIYHDATRAQRVFKRIDYAVPGCLVVYGDEGKRQGHIAVVEMVRGDVTNWRFDTIECASGLLGKMGKAIRRRKNAQSVFKPGKAIFCVLVEDFA